MASKRTYREMKPLYPDNNRCSACSYLGRYYESRGMVDLFICGNGDGPTPWLHAYDSVGNSDGASTSNPDSLREFPTLIEAARRAIEEGMLTQEQLSITLED